MPAFFSYVQSAMDKLPEGVNVAINLGNHDGTVSYYYKHRNSKKGRIECYKLPEKEMAALSKLILEKIDHNKIPLEKIHLTFPEHLEDMTPANDFLRRNIESGDYIECVVSGCEFVLKNVQDEAFTLDLQEIETFNFFSVADNFHPYLLISMNNSIEVIKVYKNGNHENIGQYFELKQLLSFGCNITGSKNLNELISLAKTTENYLQFVRLKDVDFHKTLKHFRHCVLLDQASDIKLSKSTLAWSFLFSWCSHFCHIICSHAEPNKINNVIFADGFDYIYELIDILCIFLVHISENKITPIFLRHQNFLSSLGALLKTNLKEFNVSWSENYFLSSGYVPENESKCKFVLDSLQTIVAVCPLLEDPQKYKCYTQDLYRNSNFRKYWLRCVIEAIQSSKMHHSSSRKEAFLQFHDVMISRLTFLDSYPNSYGNLSMKIIQDTLEDCKKEIGLFDTYSAEKKKEMHLALQLFKSHVETLDKLSMRERHALLAVSMLAGNMFDLGAKEINNMLNSGKFGFDEAVKKIPARPWLIDDLDDWVERMDGKPYKCAALFVDNFGFDLIIGMLPFVRELLKKDTKVVICANKDPVLNDVTKAELEAVLKSVSLLCPIINDACHKNKIIVVPVSKSSCCLDLMQVDYEFANICKEVDLIVLEGMGRAIHTNLEAEFNVDSLKVGVVKDHWLSKKLGGSDFASIFNFSQRVIDTRL